MYHKLGKSFARQLHVFDRPLSDGGRHTFTDVLSNPLNLYVETDLISAARILIK